MASESSAPFDYGRTEDRRRFCFEYLFAGCKLGELHRKLFTSFAFVIYCEHDSNLCYTSIQPALAFQIAAQVLDESVRSRSNRLNHVAVRFYVELAGDADGYLKAAFGEHCADLACF